MGKIFIIIIVLLTLFSCPLTKGQPENENSNPVVLPTKPPDMPVILSAIPVSFFEINIRWEDHSDNEANFIIERSENEDFNSFTEEIVDANTTSFIDRFGLNANTRYYYRIKAANMIGDSIYTSIRNAQTPVKPAPNSKTANHLIIDRIRLGQINAADVQNAKNTLNIGYGHTSHGSQLIDGMTGMIDFANGSGLNGAYNSNQNIFAFNNSGSGGALHIFDNLGRDCGYYPDWVDNTRTYLANNPGTNVIIWSWCGQAAGYTEKQMYERYLDPMNRLESDFSDIIFVYMTCHLDGSGAEGNLNLRNEQIRNYCLAYDKWLFDFTDIESYDPDGSVNYMLLNANDNCDYDDDMDPATPPLNWAISWQNSHTENTDWYDCGAAHSQSLNANMKAYAAWWLWCRLAGWDGN